MINPKDKDQLFKAREYIIDERLSGFWSSTEYNDFETRYENRIKAYYGRHVSSAAKWRSKLHMPTFFLACKALEAQFKEAHSQDPFIHVKLKDDSQENPEALELAEIAHKELNYDLHISDYMERKMQMDWYTILVGTAVARESIITETQKRTIRYPGTDPYGFNAGMVNMESYITKEMTCTKVIHPCNFAHDMTRQNFKDSEWGGVRYEMPISEIYEMVGDKQYHQDGVKRVIEDFESKGTAQYKSGSTHMYLERGSDLNREHMITVWEYHGPIRVIGNMDDRQVYYCLFVPSYEVFLRIGPSPFKRHPYWKTQTYPDPDGPYGVGPCDMLRPINLWENSTVNQYVDYMNSITKFMYLVDPGAINGGLSAFLDNLPFGALEKINAKDVRLEDMIQPIQHRQSSLPPIGDILQLIDKFKQDSGPSSNLRGKESGQLQDTATGISLMAQREDAVTAAIQEGIDRGIEDGMFMKMTNIKEFFQEPRVAKIGEKGEERVIGYYPYELENGGEFTFKIQRRLADVEAGKYVNFMRLVQGFDNLMTAKGMPLPPEFLVEAHEKVAQALDVAEAPEMFNKLRDHVVNLSGGTQEVSPQGPGQGQAAALPAPPPQDVSIGTGEDVNALALA